MTTGVGCTAPLHGKLVERKRMIFSSIPSYPRGRSQAPVLSYFSLRYLFSTYAFEDKKIDFTSIASVLCVFCQLVRVCMAAIVGMNRKKNVSVYLLEFEVR